MEGVPERLGPLLPITSAKRRLATTAPGAPRSRARIGSMSSSPAGAGPEAAAARLLPGASPGESAVLASQAACAISGGRGTLWVAQGDSPVGGLVVPPSTTARMVRSRTMSCPS